MQENIYYNDVMEQWLTENRPMLAVSSYEKYHQLFANHIRPYFLDVTVSQINDDFMEKYRRFLFNEKNSRSEDPLSNETIRCIVMLANRGLVQAKKSKFLDQDVRLQTRLKKTKCHIDVFTSEDQRKLETHLKNNLDILALGVFLCLYTGVRIGELCALKWSDINWQEQSLYVRRTVQRLKNIKKSNSDNEQTSLIVTPPKSDSSVRIIPIPAFLIPLLKKFHRPGRADRYIFSRFGEKPLEPRTLQYRYKNYLLQARIPYRKFHTLRHTFATRCLMMGMDIKTLSEILGHADVQTTLNYYCHTTLEYKREQMNLLIPFS